MLQVIKKYNQLCINYYIKVSFTFPNTNKIIWLRQVRTQFEYDKKRRYSSIRSRYRVLYVRSGYNVLHGPAASQKQLQKEKAYALFVLAHMPTYI